MIAEHYSKEIGEMVAFLDAKIIATNKKACDMNYWEIHEDLKLLLSSLEEARRALIDAAKKISALNKVTEKVTLQTLKASQGALVNWAKTQTLL